MIENEQREGLQPLELALFVQRRLALGETQAEIGRRLGKSRQYITLATALIDAPDWLMELYRQGRCRGMMELYELRRLGETDPGAIERLLGTDVRLTRGEIQRAREEGLATRAASAGPGPQLPSAREPRHAEAASVVRRRNRSRTDRFRAPM